MPNYMLLLHSEPVDFSKLSADTIQAMIADYKSWRENIKDEGKYVGGNKLRDDGGKSLTGQNGTFRVTDGPYTEAKELVGGYFAISAGSYDEAIELSKGCPHLKYGGRIEIREIEPTS
ncbi:MAG: YciI family protein [Candidatus Binatia bacterium]